MEEGGLRCLAQRSSIYFMLKTSESPRPQAGARRNPGLDFDAGLVAGVRIDHAATLRRAATAVARRSVKQDAQKEWLLQAIRCMDLTTLAGDDTAGRLARLCGKARQPLRPELQLRLAVPPPLRVAAVCVYPRLLSRALELLEGSEVPVTPVSTGFPAGQIGMGAKLREIRTACAAGARELEVVITREHALSGSWRKLYDEVKRFRAAAGPAHIKVILAVGDLLSLRAIARASMAAMMGGADFIKTSTGKETSNATLPAALTMLRMIRDYHDLTGCRVGFKPAGGISTAKQVLSYMVLVKEELGDEWLQPRLLRFGASSLLGDVERQLEHHATGAYSAGRRHALA